MVACAAALAHLDCVVKDGLVARAAAAGQIFGDRLRELAESYSFIGSVHGQGLVYGLHIVGSDGLTPNPQLARSIVWGCYERGLLMFAPVGFGGATVKICPPLSTPFEALEEGLSVLFEAVRAAAFEETT